LTLIRAFGDRQGPTWAIEKSWVAVTVG